MQSAGEVCYLVGAAVSGLTRTSLPSAPAAVRACIAELMLRLAPDFLRRDEIDEAAGRLASLGTQGRLVVPLESLLEQLDSSGDIGASIVREMDAHRPPSNPLHVFLAAKLEDPRTCVLTTNFDEAIERAAGDLVRPTRWIGQGVLPRDARLLKLHGTSSNRESLRHTLRMVNQRFPTGTRRAIRELTAKQLVVLGYEGADYDIIDLIAPAGEPIQWVRLPGAPDPVGVARISTHRDVNVVSCNLEEVATLVTGERTRYEGDNVTRLRSVVSNEIAELSEDTVVGLLSGLTFEASVADRGCQVVEQRFFAFLKKSDKVEWRMVHEAAREQHRGSIAGRIRSATLHVRVAQHRTTPARRWRERSDAADVLLDGWLAGQGPLTRQLSYPIHLHAAKVSGTDGWLWFRTARSARARKRLDLARRLLEQALACELNTWEEAHCFKMSGLVAALQGEPFAADLDRAQELFEFAGRTEAASDLIRTRARCELLAGDIDSAKGLLVEAITQHQRNSQRDGAVQAASFLTLLELSPRVARVYAGEATIGSLIRRIGTNTRLGGK